MLDLDGLEGVKFSDVWHNRATIVDWINDPDTWTEGARHINETVNPIYQAYGHGYEIYTGKDFNTGINIGRGRAFANLGVDAVAWATGAKASSLFRTENVLEKQMMKNSSAMGQVEKSSLQESAQKATDNELKNTVTKAAPPPPKISKTIPNKTAGDLRQEIEAKALKQKYPNASIQPERYLRDANEKIVKDPVTGEGRRFDFAVVENSVVKELVETTSLTADKTLQKAKELRIRAAGGTYIRDNKTKKLMSVENVSTTESRRE